MFILVVGVSTRPCLRLGSVFTIGNFTARFARDVALNVAMVNLQLERLARSKSHRFVYLRTVNASYNALLCGAIFSSFGMCGSWKCRKQSF